MCIYLYIYDIDVMISKVWKILPSDKKWRLYCSINQVKSRFLGFLNTPQIYLYVDVFFPSKTPDSLESSPTLAAC